MTKKYYWAIAVAAAFVFGTMISGSLVEAKPPEKDPDGDGDLEGVVFEIIGLLTDPNSGLEAIKNGEDSTVIKAFVISNVMANFDQTATCTSDKDYEVDIAFSLAPGGSIAVTHDGVGTPDNINFGGGAENVSSTLSVGGSGGDTITIDVKDASFISQAFISLKGKSSASTLECVLSSVGQP